MAVSKEATTNAPLVCRNELGRPDAVPARSLGTESTSSADTMSAPPTPNDSSRTRTCSSASLAALGGTVLAFTPALAYVTDAGHEVTAQMVANYRRRHQADGVFGLADHRPVRKRREFGPVDDAAVAAMRQASSPSASRSP